MNYDLILVKVDKNYCDYLRKFDDKVPYNFDKKMNRPFIGVVLEVNNCKYFAPLSSPKPKHLKMKNSVDFLKIDGGKLGAINFNNMIPVTDSNIKLLDLKTKKNNKNEERYCILLSKQLFWLNRHKDGLFKKSSKLYDLYLNQKLNQKIIDRCCNFKIIGKPMFYI